MCLREANTLGLSNKEEIGRRVTLNQIWIDTCLVDDRDLLIKQHTQVKVFVLIPQRKIIYVILEKGMVNMNMCI